MATITYSGVKGEFSRDEVRLIKFAIRECLDDWDISDGDDRSIAEGMLNDLGA